MTGVRIRRRTEEALSELDQLGPVRCLRDRVFLLTKRQYELLRQLRIPFEPVSHEEVREKLKGVILL
jgi:hypothetical protein